MPRPIIRVELNFGGGDYAPGSLVLDTGKLDFHTLDDTGTAWVNLADYCESVSIRSGRKRSLESFSATRFSAVLDNSDRRFDPTNLTGPYVVGTYTAIVPMRPVRIVAEWAGVIYPLAYGFADSWDITWQDPSVSTTVLSVTDAFKVLADFDPLEVAPVGAGELSGTRMDRILDNAGWSDTERDLDAGNYTMQATTLSANALTELKLVADSELGQFFVAPDGLVTFRRRSSRIVDERSTTPQALFGDIGNLTVTGGGYGELGYGEGSYGGGTETFDEVLYADLTIAYDDEILRNRANIARVGGTVQTASDEDSIARNLIHTHTRTDLLLETDAAAAEYAAAIVDAHGRMDLRFDTLVIEPDDDDELWPVALGLRFGDRVTIRRRPPGGGATIERDCYVEGIDHDIPARGKWRTTFALSQASDVTAFRLDTSALDGPDVLMFGDFGDGPPPPPEPLPTGTVTAIVQEVV